jgi:hypothetical protein
MASTLYITGILFGIIILFTILFRRFHNKENAGKFTVQESIATFISDKKIEITEMETINNYLLAIDRVNFLLLYQDNRNLAGRPLLIDLWQVKTAKTCTEEDSIYEQKKGKPFLIDKRVNKLKIQLTFIDGQPGPDLVLFEYRNAAEDFIQVKKRSDHWCQLITKATGEIPNSLDQKSKYA